MQDKTNLSPLDQLLLQFDQALRTLTPGAARPHRPSPAAGLAESELSQEQAHHAASLMRVNHTGEVCAQALYQGQALTAKLADVRENMEKAADEEADHLAWCEERIDQLNDRTSYLNPAWYAMSFGLGAAAGVAGDRWSLGFVAETERQVCEHLQEHLTRLPETDHRSRAILSQMLTDEKAHGQAAAEAGGRELPAPVKFGMNCMSSVMKKLSYRI